MFINCPSDLISLRAQNSLSLFIYFYLFYGILLFNPITGHGQNKESGESGRNDYQPHVTILPNVSYSPETRLVLGGALMYQFKTVQSGVATRSSNFVFNTVYTLNHQLMIEVFPRVLLPEEKWILDGSYYYHFYPQNYWGIGSETRPQNEWDIEYKQWWFRQAILKKVGTHLFAGPQIRMSRTYQMEFKTDGTQRPGPTTNGVLPTTTNGFGFIIGWDTRNSLMTPTKNHLIAFTAMVYPGWLGSTYPFSSWNLDMRKYIPIGAHNSSVLAMNITMSCIAGHPPFLETAALGGSEIMRGYYKGRYRDNDAIQVQVAFRQHLIGRLGFTVFSAAGQVWPNFSSIGLKNLKWAAGGGLRFNLNPHDPVNLRFDFGFGEHVTGYYLTLAEAF